MGVQTFCCLCEVQHQRIGEKEEKEKRKKSREKKTGEEKRKGKERGKDL